MQKEGIHLLQFLVCRDFTASAGDTYAGNAVFSNLYVPRFPYQLEKFCAVLAEGQDVPQRGH